MSLDLKQKSELISYTHEDIKSILFKYDRTEESINVDIKTVREWLKTQVHLPEQPSDRQILSYLIKNKFYIKKAQEKIDMNYTIKSLIPDFYKDISPYSPKVMESISQVQLLVLPKLSKNYKRIHIYRNVFKDNEENLNCYTAASLLFMNLELSMLYDISDGSVFIIDAHRATASLLVKCTPILVKKFLVVLEKVYSNRVYAIHAINIPSFLLPAFNFIKSLIKSKLKDRVHFHSEYKDILIELYGKEVIPRDYGGTEKSCDELYENWLGFLRQHDGYFKMIHNQFVNENVRPEELNDDAVLGYYDVCELAEDLDKYL